MSCYNIIYKCGNPENVIEIYFCYHSSQRQSKVEDKQRSGPRLLVKPQSRIKLSPKYPCKTRSDMSCAVDTAWHKRGFDSLTCK